MKKKAGARGSSKSRVKNRIKDRAIAKRASPRPTAGATNKVDPIDAMVAAGTQALGIPLDPAWQPSVAFNLRLILSHAAKVDGFELSDEAEPAPIFHA